MFLEPLVTGAIDVNLAKKVIDRIVVCFLKKLNKINRFN